MHAMHCSAALQRRRQPGSFMTHQFCRVAFAFCSAGTAGPLGNCSAIPTSEGEDMDTRIVVSRALSLNGPWSTPSEPLLARGAEDEWDYIVTNPSPIILPNGTTLLYYRGTPKYWANKQRHVDSEPSPRSSGQSSGRGDAPNDLPESVGLAIAPHWSGPYTKRFTQPILSVRKTNGPTEHCFEALCQCCI